MKKILVVAALAAALAPVTVGAITIEELNQITKENFEVARKVQNGEIVLPNAGSVQSSYVGTESRDGISRNGSPEYYKLYSPDWKFTGRVYDGRIYTPNWQFIGRIQNQGRR